MNGNLKYQFILHLIVLIWGVTGILGKYLEISPGNGLTGPAATGAIATKIVFFRTGIAFISLFLIAAFLKKTSLSKKQVFTLLGVGAIVGLHWIAFFYAVRISVSIAVITMSLSTLFTAFLEPIIFKRKLASVEIILSIAIVFGVILIFGFEFDRYEALIAGIISALFATTFTVLNGKYIQNIPSLSITKWEMLGAFITTLIGLSFFGQYEATLFDLRALDWVFISILSLVCTTLAFLVSVWVMKHVTPFTVSVSVNMEPIYTIILAAIIALSIGEPVEDMSWGFYLGSTIILLSVFTNAWVKKLKNSKKAKAALK